MNDELNQELHLAADETTHAKMKALLLRNSPAEEVCFALVHPSTGMHRRTLIVKDIIEPSEDERRVHGNVSFSAPLTNRAIDAAIDAGSGLALVHSHPFGRGFQAPSQDDLRAEARTLETASFALGGKPVAGMILAGDGTLSGREYTFGQPGRAPTITSNIATRIVGAHLRMQYRDRASSAPIAAAHASHVGMFGRDGQERLGRIKPLIVGVGSVGAFVNLQLPRLGARTLGGMDYDVVEERNLNRLPACLEDAAQRRTKLYVAEREARRGATCADFQFIPHTESIVEAAGVRCALDYDVLFSCADSHWSRQVLNALSYAHLIPIIDGGTGIHCDDELSFQAASFRAQPAGPGRGCLACGGAFDPEQVSVEMAGMVLPHYAGKAAAAVGAPSVIPLNIALAGLQVLRFMEIVLGISGTRELGRQRFDYAGGDVQLEVIECRSDCRWSTLTGLGDTAALPVGIDPRFRRSRSI